MDAAETALYFVAAMEETAHPCKEADGTRH